MRKGFDAFQVEKALRGVTILFANLFLATAWRLIDLMLPKRADHWAFSTHFIKDSLFIENPRALFEHVKDDPRIHKLIFVRGDSVLTEALGGRNVWVVNLQSLSGLLKLARCKVVTCDQSVSMNYALRWGGRRYSRVPLAFANRVVVNLWHGIPLKRLYGTLGASDRNTQAKSHLQREFPRFSGIIASSDVDSYAMSTVFAPIPYQNVWITGLPRNDFLQTPVERLPPYLAAQTATIAATTKGRRLVCYAPTFRQVESFAGAGYYAFSDDEMARLKSLLVRHDAVLGVRLHYFERHHHKDGKALPTLRDYVDGDRIVDVGHETVPDMAALVRTSDIIITDYSSVFIDALCIRKAVICFAYDLDSYERTQEGFLYNLKMVFPGPIATDFAALYDALERALGADPAGRHPNYDWCRSFFYNHDDDKSAERVVDRIKAAL